MTLPDTQALQSVAQTAPDLATEIVRMAANKDLDVSKLQALIEMQKQMLASQAAAAFASAFVDMQDELPIIAKTSEGDNGKWNYASLDAIVEQVRPIMRKHGFSLSHQVEWPDAKTMRVIGILTHRLGHSRRSEFLSQADTTGSKNGIQGLGSANSYGRRYTTCDLLGVATRDDDGAAYGKPPAPVVTEPAGLAPWLADMQRIAAQGTVALRAAWVKSADAFRDHMLRHRNKDWEAIKRTAAQVKAVAK
jgi:hypothetical protein